MTRIISIALFTLATAIACTKPWTSTSRYYCPDGYEFQITYSGQDNPGDLATLEDDNGSRLLPRAPSASGTRYSNEAVEFFAKDDQAMILQSGTVMHRDCTTQPPEEEQ